MAASNSSFLKISQFLTKPPHYSTNLCYTHPQVINAGNYNKSKSKK
jgi:hypothetical protein